MHTLFWLYWDLVFEVSLFCSRCCVVWFVTRLDPSHQGALLTQLHPAKNSKKAYLKCCSNTPSFIQTGLPKWTLSTFGLKLESGSTNQIVSESTSQRVSRRPIQRVSRRPIQTPSGKIANTQLEFQRAFRTTWATQHTFLPQHSCNSPCRNAISTSNCSRLNYRWENFIVIYSFPLSIPLSY